MKNFPNWVWAVVAVVASGLCFFFSVGLNGFGPLVWIAPIPILVLAFRAPPRQTAVLAFAAFLLGSLSLFGYLMRVIPAGMVMVSLLIPAIAFAVAVSATRFAVLHGNPRAAIFVFPAVWTSYEYVLSLLSPNGTAGSLAYTQTDFLPLMQLVSITGIWGVTFLLTLVPAALAIAWHLRREKRVTVFASAVTLALAASALAYGACRLSRPVEGKTLRVGLAATDTTIRNFRTEKPEEALPVVQAYAGRISRLADQGADLIVLPEKFVGVTSEYADDVYGILGSAAGEHRVFLVAGLNLIGTPLSRNAAVVFSPEGQAAAEYLKIHLIPGFEDHYQPGAQPVEFHVSGILIGLAICKDMDFPATLSRYARDGVGVLVVPAWDFGEDGEWHARMAVTRGMEGGFAVVRTAQDGLLSISDPSGRIISRERSSSAPDVLLTGDVHPGTGRTFYSLNGDWTAWLCLLSLLGMCAWIVFPKRLGGPARSREKEKSRA